MLKKLLNTEANRLGTLSAQSASKIATTDETIDLWRNQPKAKSNTIATEAIKLIETITDTNGVIEYNVLKHKPA